MLRLGAEIAQDMQGESWHNSGGRGGRGITLKTERKHKIREAKQGCSDMERMTCPVVRL